MKILHTVESYNPTVSGMQEVVSQLSERLVAMGHEVTVATKRIPERTFKELNGVKIVEFNIDGNFVRGLKGDVAKYEKFLLDSDFDVVTNFAAQQWAADIAFPLLDRLDAVKVFVPTGFSGFYQPEYRDYFNLMKDWMKKYDMNVFLSDDYRDVNFAKDNDVEKRMLIPNGADEREFLKKMDPNIRSKYGISKDSFLIFTVGSHTGQKGHKEAIEIFRRAKIKNATFFINANPVNGGCTDFCINQEKEFNKEKINKDAGKRLIVTFPPREDTVNLYKAADLFLFPSNIEASPIVIFEAMAAKTPFLSSDVGNVSEIVSWSKGGKLLPTEKKDLGGYSYVDVLKSAEVLTDFYNNSEERKELAENGYKAWEKRFTWKKISKDFENLYLKLESEHIKKAIEKVEVTVIALSDRGSVAKHLDSLNKQTFVPSEVIIVTNDTDIKDDVSKSDLKVKLITSDSSDLTKFKNQAVKDAKGDVLIFLDSNDTWENSRIESLVNKYLENGKKNDWIYPNFNALEVNKNLSEYFNVQELNLSFKGEIFGALLEQNKISSSISGSLINKKSFIECEGFDENLNFTADWDLILKLARNSPTDYIFVYESLKSNSIYLSSRPDPFNKHLLKDQIYFFNKWVPLVSSNRLVVTKWANFLVWRVTLIYPKKDLLSVLGESLSKEAKLKLFKKAFGSARLYLVIFVVYTYIKGFINSLSFIFWGFLDLIKKLFWITF